MKTSVLSRRHLFPLVGGAAAIAAVAPGSATADSLASLRKSPALKARFVYVGTYTFPGTAPGGTHPSQALGIYVFRMNPSDGGLTPLQVEQIPNPSYLALDPSLQHLYSVNEMTDGGVSAFSINQANGTLSFANMQPTNGQDTTHLSVQPSGQYLFAASYTSGNFQVFRINSDGSIGDMTDNFQDVGNGTGPNPARQEAPHAHQILTDFDGNHVFGVDLGADKVNVWNLDPSTGVLNPNVPAYLSPPRTSRVKSDGWYHPTICGKRRWSGLFPRVGGEADLTGNRKVLSAHDPHQSRTLRQPPGRVESSEFKP